MTAETLIEWGMATRALPGQEVCGDRHTVRSSPAGVMVAVVDGLGHGAEAALAAIAAVDVLERHADEPVVPLVHRCHEALRRTRGVVMSLASIVNPAPTMTWLGVGNVEALLLRAAPGSRPTREWLAQRGGVVGYTLPSLHPSTVELDAGDVLVLATDGIRGGFAEEIRPDEAPQAICERILRSHARETDDALVLVARVLGDAR